jgi:hypothetical protein
MKLDDATTIENCGQLEETIPKVSACDSLSPSTRIPAITPIDANVKACEYLSLWELAEVPRHMERLFAPRTTQSSRLGMKAR